MATTLNLYEQMNQNAVFIENFIKHEDEGGNKGGPDLESAANEREKYYDFLSTNFTLIGGSPESVQHNATRIWRKK